MNGFNFLSRQACEFAEAQDFDKSLELARQSLDLYPYNCCLILELIDIFSKTQLGIYHLNQINDLLIHILRLAGKENDVYYLYNHISFLRARIVRLIQQGQTNRKLATTPPQSINQSDSCSENLRLGILSCIWKRPELTDIFLSHLNCLRKVLINDITLEIIIIGSDPENEHKSCKDYNADYFYFPNNSVSKKWEYGLNVARDFNLDGLMILGSDDFVNSNLLLTYKSLLQCGVSIAGLPNAYFFDLNCSSPQLIFWKGYGASQACMGQPHRMGEAIGMARVFSRDFLKDLDYSLWPNLDLNSGLDYHALNRIMSFGHLPISIRHYRANNMLYPSSLNNLGQVCIDLAEINGFAVDIKYGTDNITQFANYIRCDSTHDVIPDPWSFLSKALGAETQRRLKELVLTKI